MQVLSTLLAWLPALDQVLGGQICFKHSEYENLHSLFSSRERMHRQVYTHRKAKSIEFMIADAMLEANKVLPLVTALVLNMLLIMPYYCVPCFLIFVLPPHLLIIYSCSVLMR